MQDKYEKFWDELVLRTTSMIFHVDKERVDPFYRNIIESALIGTGIRMSLMELKEEECDENISDVYDEFCRKLEFDVTVLMFGIPMAYNRSCQEIVRSALVGADIWSLVYDLRDSKLDDEN